VTASRDCEDGFGVCDMALGHFGPEESLFEGSGAIIKGYWGYFRGLGMQRWEYLFAAGLVSDAEANAWADEVWGESGDASE
jgi:hypothetical protein